MTQMIDRGGRSTIAAAEGGAALAAGDTVLAREKFAEAGEMLAGEMNAAGDGETGQLLRFLAATQFYQGGHYGKALELAGPIKGAKLPAGTRHLLPRFVQDVKDRASADYEARVRQRIQTLSASQDYAGIIEALQEHPYIVPPADLAFARALCCEMLGKYRPAVLFFADAARRSENKPAVLAALGGLPLSLSFQGRPQEAWEYAQAQVALFPNAVSYAVASVLCYQRALHADEDARTSLVKEQSHYFDRAREEYARLPPSHRDHADVKDFMGLGYQAAAWALYCSGDVRAAREMGNAAIAFDTGSPTIWTLQGAITAGSPEATEAFKKAVELGDRTVVPYYYLANDALTRRAFREALGWSLQALEREEGQDSEIKSLLYQWAGISLAHLDGPREEIEAFFEKAVEVAPESELARENYRHFQASELPNPPPLVPRFTEQPRHPNGKVRDNPLLRQLGPCHA